MVKEIKKEYVTLENGVTIDHARAINMTSEEFYEVEGVHLTPIFMAQVTYGFFPEFLTEEEFFAFARKTLAPEDVKKLEEIVEIFSEEPVYEVKSICLSKGNSAAGETRTFCSLPHHTIESRFGGKFTIIFVREDGGAGRYVYRA